jgi:hypothetical protein
VHFGLIVLVLFARLLSIIVGPNPPTEEIGGSAPALRGRLEDVNMSAL